MSAPAAKSKPKKTYTAAQKAAYALKMASKKTPKKYKKKSTTYKPSSYVTQYQNFGIDMFDATKHKLTCFPLPNSLGHSICQNYIHRVPISVVNSSSTPFIMIYTFTASNLIGMHYIHGNGSPAAASLMSNNQFNVDAPSHKRNSRFTMNILNTSSNTNLGGTITIIQTQSPLEYEFDATDTSLSVSVNFQTEILTMINNNARSKQYTGYECQKGLRLSLLPISLSALEEYDAPAIVLSTNPSQPAKDVFNLANQTSSHGTLIIRFDGIANQTYTMETHTQYAARYPNNTTLGGLGKPQPTISSDGLQKVVQTATNSTTTGEHGTYVGPAVPKNFTLRAPTTRR